MRPLAYLLLILLLPAVGCHRGPPSQAPVRGKVLVNGRPLRGGTVVFTPDTQRGARGPVSFAVLDAEGAFRLASEIGPGAVRGWHRITVAPPPESAELITALERYRHPDMSGLEFEVRESQDNSVTLALESDP